MRKTPRSRKLAIWSALPPYLGGKRRLAGTIFREIDRLVPRKHWPGLRFLDGFLGGGSVSLYAKAQGFSVTGVDIAVRSVVIGEALIANSRVRLRREDVLRLAKDDGSPAGPVEERLVPSVFTRAQGRFLDRALRTAEESPDRAKAALLRLLAIRVALLAHPMSQVRTGTAERVHAGAYESVSQRCVSRYVESYRLVRSEKLWSLARQINAGVFQGEGRVLQGSVLELLPQIEADVAYLDPPYPRVMSYEREYKVIDQILEGASRPTSPFTAKTGANLLDELFERARHIPLWVLSLGNAVVTVDELEAKMRRLGRETKALEIHHQHLPAVATEEKKRKNREFLVVGWDPDSLERLLRSRSTEHAARVHLRDHAVSLVQEEADGPGASRHGTQELGADRLEEREAPLAEKAASPRRHSVSVADRGLDDPDAVLSERSRTGDGERRLR